MQEFYHGVPEKEVVREDSRERERITIERGMRPGDRLETDDEKHTFVIAQKEHPLFKRFVDPDDKEKVYDLFYIADVGILEWLMGGTALVPTMEIDKKKSVNVGDGGKFAYHFIEISFGPCTIPAKKLVGWGMPKNKS